MDAPVEAALNLLPSNTDSATSFSLYGLLNKAQSPMGKALLKVSGCCLLWLQVGRWGRQAVVTGCRGDRCTCLRACGAACCTRRCRACRLCTAALPQAWIKHPLVDIEAIRERHDVVEGLAEDAQLRADLRGLHLRGECGWGAAVCCPCEHGWELSAPRLPHLGRPLHKLEGTGCAPLCFVNGRFNCCQRALLPPGLPDLDKLLRKLESGRIGLQELCQMYRASAKLPQAR